MRACEDYLLAHSLLVYSHLYSSRRNQQSISSELLIISLLCSKLIHRTHVDIKEAECYL